MVQFSLFHLMPYPYLERMPGNWPVPHKLFEPERASADYQRYLDQMALRRRAGLRLGRLQRAPLLALRPDEQPDAHRRRAVAAHAAAAASPCSARCCR